MTTTYIHKLNLGVNVAYNMRHALTGFAQGSHRPKKIDLGPGKLLEFEKVPLSWNCPGIL